MKKTTCEQQKKMRTTILAGMLACTSIASWADGGEQGYAVGRFLGSCHYQVRLEYNIGATTPLGMPASIRTLHSYSLRPDFGIGIDAAHSLSGRWGLAVGIRLDRKGMKTDAGVKGYHMKIVRGGEELEGTFTGSVVTKASMLLITVPIQATYGLGDNVRLKLGPYASYAAHRNFEGWAYDGYLRRQEEGHPKGDPTGQKVMLGSDEGERGEYDFSDEMRRWQMGLDLGVDWQIGKRWGVSADVNWGLTGIFRKGFDTIEQTMYPIYGSVAVTYRLK